MDNWAPSKLGVLHWGNSTIIMSFTSSQICTSFSLIHYYASASSSQCLLFLPTTHHPMLPKAHYKQNWRMGDGRRTEEGVTLPQDPLSKILLEEGNKLICIFLLKHTAVESFLLHYAIWSSWVCPQACSQALDGTENTCMAHTKMYTLDKFFQSLRLKTNIFSWLPCTVFLFLFFFYFPLPSSPKADIKHLSCLLLIALVPVKPRAADGAKLQ